MSLLWLIFIIPASLLYLWFALYTTIKSPWGLLFFTIGQIPFSTWAVWNKLISIGWEAPKPVYNGIEGGETLVWFLVLYMILSIIIAFLLSSSLSVYDREWKDISFPKIHIPRIKLPRLKVHPKIKNKGGNVQKVKSWVLNSFWIAFLTSIAFLGLEIWGKIDWGVGWVFSPLWMWGSLIGLIGIVALCLLKYVVKILGGKNGK